MSVDRNVRRQIEIALFLRAMAGIVCVIRSPSSRQSLIKTGRTLVLKVLTKYVSHSSSSCFSFFFFFFFLCLPSLTNVLKGCQSGRPGSSKSADNGIGAIVKTSCQIFVDTIILLVFLLRRQKKVIIPPIRKHILPLNQTPHFKICTQNYKLPSFLSTTVPHI